MPALRIRRSGKARVIGKPGRSASGLSRLRLSTRYRQIPTRYAALATTLIAVVVAACTHSIGKPWQPATMVTAGILIAAHIALRYPGATLSALLTVVFLGLGKPIAYTYAYAATAGKVTDAGGYLSLIVLALTTVLLAHRTSRSRPWLTILFAYAAVGMVGPFLLFLIPGAGFAVAYALTAIVIAVRAGAIGNIRARIARIRDRRAARRADRQRDKTAWQRGAEGEKRTATILADLDNRHTVLHDLALPGTAANVDHVVVGPGGLIVIDSKMYAGVVRVHPKRGLEYNGRPLAETLSTCLFERDRVAAELDLDPAEVPTYVVIHDAVLPAPRSRVALLADDGAHLGEVTVLSPQALLDEIAARPETLTPKHTKDLVRRTQQRLSPAGTGKATGPRTYGWTPAATEAVVLDADGNHAAANEAGQPLFIDGNLMTDLRLGDRAGILTDQGTFSGLRVAACPALDADGIAVIGLCPEQEWSDAQAAGQEPPWRPYPLASVVAA